MRSIFIPLLSLLAIGTLSAATSALFEQSGPIINGWYSDTSLAHPQSLGELFHTDRRWSVDAITWLGGYDHNSQPTDDFLVNIWSTGADRLPAVLLSMDRDSIVRRFTGETTTWGAEIYEYRLGLAEPLLLDAGTSYVLEIQNSTPEIGDNWFWMTSRDSAQFLYHTKGVWYYGDRGALQFSIQGQIIPEPGLPLLFLGSLQVLLCQRRRRVSPAA